MNLETVGLQLSLPQHERQLFLQKQYKIRVQKSQEILLNCCYSKILQWFMTAGFNWETPLSNSHPPIWKKPCRCFFFWGSGFFLCQPRYIYNSVTLPFLEISAVHSSHKRISFINSIYTSYFMAEQLCSVWSRSTLLCNGKGHVIFWEEEQDIRKEYRISMKHMVHNIGKSNRKPWGKKSNFIKVRCCTLTFLERRSFRFACQNEILVRFSLQNSVHSKEAICISHRTNLEKFQLKGKFLIYFIPFAI